VSWLPFPRALWKTSAMELPQKIMRKLELSPYSIQELSFDLRADVVSVRLIVNALLKLGEIARLEGREVEGGPFYCLPGYREPERYGDHSDIVMACSYAIEADETEL
jgi:hypothetical protein